VTLKDGRVVHAGEDEDSVVGHVARSIDQATRRKRVGVDSQFRDVDALVLVHTGRRGDDLVVLGAVVRTCGTPTTLQDV